MMVLKEILQHELLSIIQFVLVMAIGIILTKLITDFINGWLRSPTSKRFIQELGYDEPFIDLVIVGVRYLLYLITFVIAIAQFGFASMIFDAIIILIALFLVFIIIYSLKDFIPNITAGIYLAQVKAIKKGDKIKIGYYSGEVIDMNLFTTTLKDETGRVIIIPNSNLTKKEIIKGELPKEEEEE